MKILSIIPARGGSKGIPKKNLAILNKKPLLHYTINASVKSNLIDRTVVSTDDKEIADFAKKYDVQIIKRPKKLSSDNVGLEPVIDHVLKFLERNDKYVPDVIVLLQNTSPLRNMNHVNEALKLFQKMKFDSLLSGFVSHKFLWKSKNSCVFPVNYNPKKRLRRQKISDQFIENGAIYITKKQSFKKNKCRISGDIGMYVMPEELSIEIDNEYELTFAENILKMINHE